MTPLPTAAATLFTPGTLALILIAAVGYSAATIGMKMGSSALTVFAIVIMGAGLAAAVWGEITVLRGANLGPVYIAILGVETLIVMTYAWYIGEALSLRQLGGGVMVIAGLMLVNQ